MPAGALAGHLCRRMFRGGGAQFNGAAQQRPGPWGAKPGILTSFVHKAQKLCDQITLR